MNQQHWLLPRRSRARACDRAAWAQRQRARQHLAALLYRALHCEDEWTGHISSCISSPILTMCVCFLPSVVSIGHVTAPLPMAYQRLALHLLHSPSQNDASIFFSTINSDMNGQPRG